MHPKPKHFIFLRASAAPGALQLRLLQRFGRVPFAVSVNLVQRGDIAPPWDIVIEAWVNAAELVASLDDDDLRPLVAARAIYRVEELVEKDQGPAEAWPVSGIRLIVPWTGRGDVTPAEQRRHWDEHVPLANRVHVGVTRYVRNWVEAVVGDAAGVPPYQGIASQHYPSERDLHERSFDTPASVRVIHDDVAEFIAEPVVLRVTEYRRASRD